LARIPSLPGYDRMASGPDLIKPFLDAILAVRLAGLSADIVHDHNYEAPLAAALSRLWTGTPVVYSAHNTMREELPTYFSSRLMGMLAKGIGSTLDHSVPRLADYGIAINPASVQTLRRLGCSEVKHIPPGINPDEFVDVNPAVLGEGPWVVYAGNTDAYQDLDILFEAMKYIQDASLLIVSSTPPPRWSTMTGQKIRYVQTTDFSEVCGFLAAADVAVLPRSVCSGYPMKLLNYLGMGLPTVAAAGSARKMPGVVVVPNRDPIAVADAVKELLANDDRRFRMGRQARGHVLQRCSWDARAVELEEVYHSLLDVKNASVGVNFGA